jgi:hypothetical protein
MGAAGLISPGGVSTDVSDAQIARFLGQVNVSIDGTTQSMFALGTRQSFPAGTCMEDLFTSVSLPPYTDCTPPAPGVSIFLWQSHSASALPDRMIFIAADAGTSNFSFPDNFDFESPAVFPALAIYMQGTDSFWSSLSGSLTSQIAATSQSCDLPLPPYAKAATCNVANFDEQGSITFEEFSENGLSGRHLTVTIPPQTVHGLWLDITETQQAGMPWDYNLLLGAAGAVKLQPRTTLTHTGSATNSAR